jgi:hypothetical protein
MKAAWIEDMLSLAPPIAFLIAVRIVNKRPTARYPVSAQIDAYLRGLSWVDDAGSRMRDMGHVFHVESFLVPRRGRMPSLAKLEEARAACVALDWKVEDIVLIPVSVLPAEVGSTARASGAAQGR